MARPSPELSTTVQAETHNTLPHSISSNDASPKGVFETRVQREETQTLLASGWVRDTQARLEKPIVP